MLRIQGGAAKTIFEMPFELRVSAACKLGRHQRAVLAMGALSQSDAAILMYSAIAYIHPVYSHESFQPTAFLSLTHLIRKA